MKTIIQCAALIMIAVSSIAEADELTSAFLKKHCIRCHGSEDQSADRRFDTLSGQIKTLDDLERFQEIVDQLNLQKMPPEDEVQPTAEARAKLIERLTQRITTAHSELNTSGGHSVLRRLNSWEYRQTIGDLLRINVDVWNPAEDFPAEVTVEGFDNNGAGLVTSGRLMDHYFGGAEEAIRRALSLETAHHQRNTRSSRHSTSKATTHGIFRNSSKSTATGLFRKRHTPISMAAIIAADTSDSCHCCGRAASITAASIPFVFERQP